MTTSDSDSSFAWHDIEEHHLILRGIHSRHASVEPSLTFVARSVLSRADALHLPDAIDFDTEIRIPDDGATQPIQYRRRLGFYGRLATVRSDFAAFRSGESHEVTLSMTGLTLQLFSNDAHTRGAVCVSGTLSNVHDTSDWPWPKHPNKIASWLGRNHTPAYNLRFAFLTSLVDPPSIDNFIHDIDKLLAHLQDLSTP